MVFFLKRMDQRLDQMDEKLSVSFERVKQDTDHIHEWLRYLYDLSKVQHKKIEEQSETVDSHESEIAMHKRLIRELKQELSVIPRTREEMRELMDLEPLLDRIQKLEQRIVQMGAKRSSAPRTSFEPREPRTSALQEKVLRRIARNSKEYIKSVIQGIIAKYGKMSALQLREMIVEDQGLCSKSSFYRILEELEKENTMQLVSRGKEKVYVTHKK
jgi:hypothetical protein